MLRQILLQLFFILAKKNLCTFLLWGHTTRSTKSENLMPCHENNMVLYILKHYYRPKGYIFYQLVQKILFLIVQYTIPYHVRHFSEVRSLCLIKMTCYQRTASKFAIFLAYENSCTSQFYFVLHSFLSKYFAFPTQFRTFIEEKILKYMMKKINSRNMANFEAFRQVISSSINL